MVSDELVETQTDHATLPEECPAIDARTPGRPRDMGLLATGTAAGQQKPASTHANTHKTTHASPKGNPFPSQYCHRGRLHDSMSKLPPRHAESHVHKQSGHMPPPVDDEHQRMNTRSLETRQLCKPTSRSPSAGASFSKHFGSSPLAAAALADERRCPLMCPRCCPHVCAARCKTCDNIERPPAPCPQDPPPQPGAHLTMSMTTKVPKCPE